MSTKTRATPAKTPPPRKLPFNGDELIALCKEAGFRIGRSSRRGTIVTNPATNDSCLVSEEVRAGRVGRNLHADLVRIGLVDALEKAEAERETERRLRIDQDKKAADAAIAAADAAADAAGAAAGAAADAAVDAVNNTVRHLIQFTPPKLVASGNGAINGTPATPTPEPASAPAPTPAKMPARATQPPARTARPPAKPASPSTSKPDDGPGEMYTEKRLVTPELALEWLTREEARLPNGAKVLQRPRRPAHVKELARMMANPGEWLVTPQGIALAPEPPWNTGAVLDGQHRLEAIIEYGKPVYFMVTYNVDPQTFKVLDTGKPRSAADVLGIMGEKSTLNLASLAKLLHVYNMAKVDPGILTEWRNWARIKASNTEMAAALESRPQLGDEMNQTRPLVGPPLKFNLSAATMFRIWLSDVWPAGAAIYPGHKLSPIDEWLTTIRDGVGLGLHANGNRWPEDPMLVVRNWALDPKKITRLYTGAVREAALLALIRAWNYHLRGRGMAYVHIKSNDAMPTPLPGTLPD